MTRATTSPAPNAPALHRQLEATAHVVGLVRQGRSLPDALGEVPGSLRPGVQALASDTLRELGRAQSQLAALVHPGFLRETPSDALAQLPRYVKAMRLRAERAATYSPVLPVSPSSGRVLQVPVEVVDAEAGTIRFVDEDGSTVEQSALGGTAACIELTHIEPTHGGDRSTWTSPSTVAA